MSDRDIRDRKIRFVGVVRLPETGFGVPGVARGPGGGLRVDLGAVDRREGSIGEPDRHQQETGRRRPEEATSGVVSLCAHGSTHT
jgi:hypothetical protein